MVTIVVFLPFLDTSGVPRRLLARPRRPFKISLGRSIVSSCPFCLVERARIWIENEHAIAIADQYPVTEGHKLVIPREHVASIYQLRGDQQVVIWKLVGEVRERLLTGLKPDGFNIGVNDGIAAGQTVEHARVHIIPGARATCPIHAAGCGGSSTRKQTTGRSNCRRPRQPIRSSS